MVDFHQVCWSNHCIRFNAASPVSNKFINLSFPELKWLQNNFLTMYIWILTPSFIEHILLALVWIMARHLFIPSKVKKIKCDIFAMHSHNMNMMNCVLIFFSNLIHEPLVNFLYIFCWPVAVVINAVLDFNHEIYIYRKWISYGTIFSIA